MKINNKAVGLGELLLRPTSNRGILRMPPDSRPIMVDRKRMSSFRFVISDMKERFFPKSLRMISVRPASISLSATMWTFLLS